MPNYCSNTLTLSHKDPKKVEKIYRAILDNRLCDEVIPLPKTFLEYNSPCDMPDNEKEMHEKEYGADNWYDFCVERWGTKWDIMESSAVINYGLKTTVTASFLTAWSPPTGIYQALVDDGFEVKSMYFECGMGFAGIFDNNGESNYDDMQFIPEELDEAFGITESYNEMEEEEE